MTSCLLLSLKREVSTQKLKYCFKVIWNHPFSLITLQLVSVFFFFFSPRQNFLTANLNWVHCYWVLKQKHPPIQKPALHQHVLANPTRAETQKSHNTDENKIFVSLALLAASRLMLTQHCRGFETNKMHMQMWVSLRLACSRETHFIVLFPTSRGSWETE